jgi:hypothetical protein
MKRLIVSLLAGSFMPSIMLGLVSSVATLNAYDWMAGAMMFGTVGLIVYLLPSWGRE